MRWDNLKTIDLEIRHKTFSKGMMRNDFKNG
jgi:hypothetical protein